MECYNAKNSNFGATGSIGVSTLEVIKLHPDKFSVFALTANNNATLLYQQCLEFNPSYAYINGADVATTLQHRLLEANSNTQVLSKPEDLAYLAAHPEVDLVMSAIVGSAGLVPTYYAAKNGKNSFSKQRISGCWWQNYHRYRKTQ